MGMELRFRPRQRLPEVILIVYSYSHHGQVVSKQQVTLLWFDLIFCLRTGG
jgi:hypothetical protein